MSAKIIGLGSWLPSEVRTNDFWPESFRNRQIGQGDRTFNDIEAPPDPIAAAMVGKFLETEEKDPFLGAVERRVAADIDDCATCEAVAAKRALVDAGVRAEEIDLILACAMVPERVVPMSGPGVAHRIGAVNAQAVSIDTACASALTSLEMAKAYINSGMAKNVLLVQSHLILRAMPAMHPATPGLGDICTAMVVSGRPGIGLLVGATFAVTHGQDAETVCWVRGHGDDDDPPWWKAGGDYRLGTRSMTRVKMLMRDTIAYGKMTLEEVFRREGITGSDVNVFTSVQPRRFIPEAIAEYAGIPAGRTVETYKEIAHVGVCGPVYNLERARFLGLLKPGVIVAIYAQGAGFTRAATVLRVQE